ncbi:SIR2-like domain-containing protein [Hymenobacter daecheongensis DSM 21074]|uniref:SIR2-like domain-containing protein n=1 Tax=Hymenobacter daecheongensis DSM 21074 TaxID=1121955 RepID=A0A1M6B4A7_9BACT|nr:SIR2 family protein [Hymenobacter daecheongensis]SHI43497.1 SIR2-like domain-containing protein [Hymenobacter daecheongensis DSM 21074]
MSFIIPDDLVELFDRRACGLYVGAGLSQAAGFPSWGQLLQLLVEEVGKRPYNVQSKIEDYKKLLNDPNQYLLVAEDIKAQLGDRFSKFMSDTFSDQTKKPTETLKNFMKLPLKFVITTNYDMLIEQAYNKVHDAIPATLTYDLSKDIAHNLWEDKFFVLKAHGDVQYNSGRLIISERDYRDILFRQPGYQSALHAMFSSKSVLFVGTSFTDPDLILLLRYLHSSFHGGGPTHYILLAEDSVLDTQSERYMHDFNLHTIKYDKKDGHKEINEFAIELLSKIKESN